MTTRLSKPAGLLHLWRRIKAPVGYALFAAALGYGLWHAPDELWQLRPVWLLASLGMVVLMFLLQQWQVSVFLRAHEVHPGWLYPALFNARKGILNTVLPARSGTLLLLRSLTDRYAIKWHSFLYFFLLAGLVSIYVSALALAWLLWPWGYSVTMLCASYGLSLYLARRTGLRYARSLPALLLIAVGLYLATVGVFFCLLRGLGYALDVVEVSYFAVVLNVLTQIAITPGNIGVREVVMGMIAPYVALPISVGIIAGSVLLVLRLAVYGAFWAVLEWLFRRAEQRRLAAGGS